MMKTRFALFLLCLFLSFSLCTAAFAEKNPWDIKLPFKEATIQYSITGSETGSETLYIRDYGKEKASHRKSTSKIMFMTTQTDQIEITNPDWVYTIDMKERTGTKVTNPVKFMIEEYNKLSSKEKDMVNKNVQEMGTSLMQGMQGSVQQNAEKILGYNCDLASVAGTTSYSMHGTDITLKSDVSMMGMKFSTVATKITEGSVPGDVFAPPPGIQVTHDKEADDAARAMAKSTIDTLKSPDASQKMQQQAGDAMNQAESAGQQAPPANQGSGQDMQKAMDALKGMFGK
ncbi:MAG: hypothetical protein KKA54_17260 [Proteobacteria bacterium]|nr:hypothetical protein [Pseudomonadota bacterium]MBU0968116.1 hypothetical protein [Pseudomonadota bacterium]